MTVTVQELFTANYLTFFFAGSSVFIVVLITLILIKVLCFSVVQLSNFIRASSADIPQVADLFPFFTIPKHILPYPIIITRTNFNTLAHNLGNMQTDIQ